jgi:hypothetical protein
LGILIRFPFTVVGESVTGTPAANVINYEVQLMAGEVYWGPNTQRTPPNSKHTAHKEQRMLDHAQKFFATRLSSHRHIAQRPLKLREKEHCSLVRVSVVVDLYSATRACVTLSVRTAGQAVKNKKSLIENNVNLANNRKNEK